MTLRLDSTRLSLYQRCPEKYRLQYAHDWDLPSEPEALAAGQAWHKAREVWFSKPESDVEAALAALRAAWTIEEVEQALPFSRGEHKPQLTQRPLELFERMLAASCARFPREADDFIVHAAEGYFEQPTSWGIYNGRKDLLAERDGTLFVLDSKTTSWPPNPDEYRTKSQMLGYCWDERKRGRDVQGVVIDYAKVNKYYWGQVKRDGTRSLLGGKVNQDDFTRCWIEFEDWQFEEFEEDVERLGKQIAAQDPAERWARNGNECFSFNTKCIFFDLCAFVPPAIREDHLRANFVKRHWDPEEIE